MGTKQDVQLLFSTGPFGAMGVLEKALKSAVKTYPKDAPAVQILVRLYRAFKMAKEEMTNGYGGKNDE